MRLGYLQKQRGHNGHAALRRLRGGGSQSAAVTAPFVAAWMRRIASRLGTCLPLASLLTELSERPDLRATARRSPRRVEMNSSRVMPRDCTSCKFAVKQIASSSLDATGAGSRIARCRDV